MVRIVDSGPGIPPALVGQIFTPFFTTKEPGQGTGLGLSISYGIVESHGGHLSCAPAEGGGSVFTIRLPLSGGGAAAADTVRPGCLLVDADRLGAPDGGGAPCAGRRGDPRGAHGRRGAGQRAGGAL